ncbi:hypothetical protein C8Q74DRAFT_1222718 [Fomes fomentarius]|nr:hypothetical protein C8Q74DRAFT_1222718 [Fomes fomentarius]
MLEISGAHLGASGWLLHPDALPISSPTSSIAMSGGGGRWAPNGGCSRCLWESCNIALAHSQQVHHSVHMYTWGLLLLHLHDDDEEENSVYHHVGMWWQVMSLATMFVDFYDVNEIYLNDQDDCPPDSQEVDGLGAEPWWARVDVDCGRLNMNMTLAPCGAAWLPYARAEPARPHSLAELARRLCGTVLPSLRCQPDK